MAAAKKPAPKGNPFAKKPAAKPGQKMAPPFGKKPAKKK